MQITAARPNTSFPMKVHIFSRNPKVSGTLPSYTAVIDATITSQPFAAQLGSYGADWTFTGYKMAGASTGYD